MKTTKISFFAFALSCFFVFALSSCRTEDFPPIENEEGEYGYIFATLSTPRNGCALNDIVTDNTINSVRIFVFIGDYLETQKLFVRGETEWDNPFRLRVVLGQKNVMVVANEQPEMTYYLGRVQTVNDLYDVFAKPIKAPLSFNPAIGLPMTGRIDGVSVIDAEPTSTRTDIRLVHMTARLDIAIVDGSNGRLSHINNITLHNNKGISLLWDRSDDAFLKATEDIFFDLEYTANEVAAMRPLNSNKWTLPVLYLYENLHGRDNRDKATRLEIEAVLQIEGYDDFGLPALVYFPIIYSVYINEHLPNTSTVNSPEDQRFLIQRGHHYRLTGTIWGTEYTHITVKMEAKPWQPGNSSPQRPLPPPIN